MATLLTLSQIEIVEMPIWTSLSIFYSRSLVHREHAINMKLIVSSGLAIVARYPQCWPFTYCLYVDDTVGMHSASIGMQIDLRGCWLVARFAHWCITLRELPSPIPNQHLFILIITHHLHRNSRPHAQEPAYRLCVGHFT